MIVSYMYVGTNIIILFYLNPSLIIVSEKTHAHFAYLWWATGKFKLFWVLNFIRTCSDKRKINKNYLIAYTLLLSHGMHTNKSPQKVTKYFIIRTVMVNYFFGIEQGNNSSTQKMNRVNAFVVLSSFLLFLFLFHLINSIHNCCFLSIDSNPVYRNTQLMKL